MVCWDFIVAENTFSRRWIKQNGTLEPENKSFSSHKTKAYKFVISVKKVL